MISHTFSIDELILGGSLESLLYAYKTETPIIIDNPKRPFEFDLLPSEFDLSFLGYDPKNDTSCLRLWERLSFLLSLSGLLLFPNSIENMTEHDGRITVVTHNMRKLEVTFNKLRKFDRSFTNYAWVYDWFAVRSGGKHEIDILEDKEYLAHKLIFYPSQRIGVRSSKDVVAVTYLKIDNIFDIEYSESYVSLKTRRMMKEAGIVGTSKGFNKYKNRMHEPIRIEHMHRERKEQIIPQMTLGQIMELPTRTEGKLWNMTTSLFKRKLLFT